MAGYPPPYPPPPPPPPGYDPRSQRRYLRDQARAQRAAYRAQRYQMHYQMRSLRRTSILGPILLIAIGVLFLLLETGRIAHQQFWDWYGRWWPMLLVVAGAMLLAEWAFDQYRLRDPNHIPYRRSIGSGVVLLLLAIVFTGVITRHVYSYPGQGAWIFNGLHLDQGNFDEFFGDKHEYDQMLDFALPAGNSIFVQDPRGDVNISGASDDGRVHVAIHKQVYAHSDSDANTRAQKLSPHIASDGNILDLTVPSIDGTRADLIITVPPTAAATVTANHGNVQISSIKAAVNATANHGDIELSAITGPATAHINSSGSSLSAHSLDSGLTIEGRAQDLTLADITGPVSVHGEFFGTSHFEHIAGPIHFHTSRTDYQLGRLDGEAEISPHSDLSTDQGVGPLVLTTSNRNITLDRISGDIAVTDRNGSIDLTAAPNLSGTALGAISLVNRNGSIKATLPEQTGFSIQANTTNGDIDTGFSLSTQESGNHKSINGTVGSGGPLLHLTTTNGDISLQKADIAPLPPIAPTPKITLVPARPAAK